MYVNRIFKWASFVLLLLAFGLDSRMLLQAEAATCMGVKILTEEELGVYTEYRRKDYSDLLEFNGAPAAVDTGTATVYLSENIRKNSRSQDLPGKLKVNSEDLMLYFAPDTHFSDMAAATEAGHTFTLLVVSGDNAYMKYNVVFTTLPVLRVDGAVTHKNEDNEDVREGNMCLWTPAELETGRSSVQTSALEWHIRGKSSKNEAKKSWKLSLRDQEGLNNDLDFLGQGADDDWILNALVRDDTKLKEKLFMDLWNEWTDQSPWNYKMSTGEYVEVVSNGRYSGVYLLQRRIDRKYYRLAENDILISGVNNVSPETIEEAYCVDYSPFSEAETLALMEGIFTGNDVSMIQLDNFLDVNLFLQYASAIDNVAYKNMFFLLKWQEDGYRLFMIPWDTDMSWGISYTTDFVYDYQRSMNAQALRREYPAVLREIPELKTLMTIRWEELRSCVFSEEHVLKILEEHQEALNGSGVLKRDQNRWGERLWGNDTYENLTRFLRERLYRLDEYYAQ